jgi:Ca2+-binding EF-hand superfamily protein
MSISGIGSGGGFDLSKMASSMASKIEKEVDTDQSGSVNKSEFVSGMTAKGISATDASAKFDSIDTKKTGSISQSDIETNIKSSAPKDGAPPGGGAKPPSGAKGAPPAGGGGQANGSSSTSSSSSTKSYEKADANKDGTVSQVEQLLYSMKHPEATSSSDNKTSTQSLGKTIDVQA